jgi:hypothetical protein
MEDDIGIEIAIGSALQGVGIITNVYQCILFRGVSVLHSNSVLNIEEYKYIYPLHQSVLQYLSS